MPVSPSQPLIFGIYPGGPVGAETGLLQGIPDDPSSIHPLLTISRASLARSSSAATTAFKITEAHSPLSLPRRITTPSTLAKTSARSISSCSFAQPPVTSPLTSTSSAPASANTTNTSIQSRSRKSPTSPTALKSSTAPTPTSNVQSSMESSPPKTPSAR